MRKVKLSVLTAVFVFALPALAEAARYWGEVELTQ